MKNNILAKKAIMAKKTRKFLDSVRAVELIPGDSSRYFIDAMYIEKIQKAVKKGLIEYQRDFLTGRLIDYPEDHKLEQKCLFDHSYTAYGFVVSTKHFQTSSWHPSGSHETIAVSTW